MMTKPRQVDWPSVSEYNSTLDEFMADIDRVIYTSRATGAVVVLFNKDSAKSFQFHATDDDFTIAIKLIRKHKRMGIDDVVQ